MLNFLNSIKDALADGFTVALLRSLIVLLIGLTLARFVSATLGKMSNKKFSAQGQMLIRRGAFYLIFGLTVASALRQLGFDLSFLLGAAGILTVAIGFASQTSASNLISGLFLLAEQPFVVGDVIRIGSTSGEVIAVDLLSVQLRTFDNLLVRLPNEALLKSEITNLTRFPIRRIDLKIGVAYKEDLQRVQDELRELAERNPLCLDEPKPVFQMLGFGDSSIDLQFSVWTITTNFLEVKTQFQLEIKQRFDEVGIEIPFPHRTLYTGSETRPWPVEVSEFHHPQPEEKETDT